MSCDSPLAALPASPAPVSAPGQCWWQQDRQEGRGEERTCHGHGGLVLVLVWWEQSERLPGEQLPALLLCQFSEQRPSSVSSERSQGRLRLLQGLALGSIIALGGEPSGNHPESSLGRGEPAGLNGMQALQCSAPSAQAAVILAAGFIGAGMRLAGAACASLRGPGAAWRGQPRGAGGGGGERRPLPSPVLGRCCF